MTTMTMKRKPAEPDFSAVTNLNDLPSVAAADGAARDARVRLHELEAEDRALDSRSQSADAWTQRAAARERRQLAPQLEEAADQAVKARAAAEETRESARRQILAAHVPAIEARYRRLATAWGAAEAESTDTLGFLHQLAQMLGHEAVSHHVAVVRGTGLIPGRLAEWRALVPGAIGLDV